MPFTYDEIKEIADKRKQTPIGVIRDGRESWCLVDCKLGTINKLAESFNTDDWEKWTEGKFAVQNRYCEQITDFDEIVDLSQLWPFYFRSME